MTSTRKAWEAREDAHRMARVAEFHSTRGRHSAAHYWRTQAEQARADADRLEKDQHADRR